MVLVTLGTSRTVIDQPTPAAVSLSTSFQDQNAESARTVTGPDTPRGRSWRGPGRAPSHPGVHHLPGARTGGEQWVEAEDFGVTVRGALFLFAVHLGHGRVEVDHQVFVGFGSRTRGPRVGQHPADDLVELADMAERERAEERPDRRGCQRVEPQHFPGRPGSEPVERRCSLHRRSCPSRSSSP